MDPDKSPADPQIHEQEGVIKFDLAFTQSGAPSEEQYRDLEDWRHRLFQLGLTGQDPTRYGGLAFGNVSRKLNGYQFLISGSQTGRMAHLKAEHYCFVDEVDLENNRLRAHGPIPPSSEAMTHGAVYQLNHPKIAVVLHVHCPTLWQNSRAFRLPETSTQAAYGTPAMAQEVAEICRASANSIIVMKGHLDGILAIGQDLAGTAKQLIALAQAATN
jgi:ribulose-5-phosphate 4-epimerase/fuculose-1-phosphate aldolase